MADFDSRLPVRGTATDLTTEVANAAGTTINPCEDYAQGSTTTGENGPLCQGAVTTANPAYTTGQTSPLSLDVNGNLRVIVSDQGGGASTSNFFTDVAVASGASVNHSVAGVANVDQVHVSGSGEVKVVIADGTTGSEVTHIVGFTSAASKNFDWTYEHDLVLTGAQSIKVTITNEDKQSQDLYLTIMTH